MKMKDLISFNAKNEMNDQIIAGIGKKVRSIRQQQNLKLHEVAKEANISKSLLSKIENGRSVPSLPVLVSIIQVLKVEFSAFFEGIEANGHVPYIHKKKEDYVFTEKESAIGFIYRHILSKHASSVIVEAVILDLQPNSKRDFVTTDGFEFKYVLSGRVEYHIGEHIVEMEAGDSLFFDGRTPHVPINKSDKNCSMLVVYLLTPPEV
ncbi:transcriptional regulator with XRE-family HTH domain [Catalinimonas alkaloidigena]|uniref:helix-turn-helix domain-containing protein n=1 Tax=Catalinimonas alkaloidigena TaxID=1075417 RepID=UPI002405D225|nr:XRE family transcriptional regulator [Catalinimonas alkaloidigena]MDF9798545.1 transcriptional regulator with XRE-family HTH domain [Catalinimonas alkaloidigena]